MLSFCNANFWKSVQCTTRLPKDAVSRSFSNTMYLVPRYFSPKEKETCTGFSFRPFYTTGLLRLKTLFSESEQSKIVNFVNKLNPEETLWTGKLKILNKIAGTLPEMGKMADVNDLLERYSLPSTTAVSLCKTILESSGEPNDLLSINVAKFEKKKLKKNNPPRKLNYLWRTIKPPVSDCESVSSFTTVVVFDNFIGYAVLQKQSDWNSQLLMDWSVHDISGLSQRTDAILDLAKVLPSGEHYVVAGLSSGAAPFNQYKSFGIVVALLCAKNGFREDLPQKLFEMSGRSPARFFNLIVGNEVVSSGSMVSDCLSRRNMSDTDDHVYRRSLKEVTFEEEAVGKYNAYDDDMKGTLEQTLLVAKGFIEALKFIQHR